MQKKRDMEEAIEAERMLFQAILNDSVFGVENALKECEADPTCRDFRGDTPLHYAAWGSDNPVEYPSTYTSRIMRILVENGADVNATNRNGQTPLHEATLRDFSYGVRELLKLGADMDCVDRQGLTPRGAAKARGQKNILEMFAEEDACRRKTQEAARAAEAQKHALEEAMRKRNLALIDKLMQGRKR